LVAISNKLLWVGGGLAAAALGYWGYKRWNQYRVFGPVTATASAVAAASGGQQSPLSLLLPQLFTPDACPFNLSAGDSITARNGNVFQVTSREEYGSDPIYKMTYGTATGALHCSDMYKYFPVPGESVQDRYYATSEEVPESELAGAAVRIL
jgi:hypothetical protein